MAIPAWSESGDYSLSAFVYDLAQLIHQQRLAPCRIVAHSLGGSIALRYAGAFPRHCHKLVSIEEPRPVAHHDGPSEPSAGPGRAHPAAGSPRPGGSPPASPLARPRRSRDAFHPHAGGEVADLTEESRRAIPPLHGAGRNEGRAPTSEASINYVRSFSAGRPGARAHLPELWRNIACPILFGERQGGRGLQPREGTGRTQYFRGTWPRAWQFGRRRPLGPPTTAWTSFPRGVVRAFPLGGPRAQGPNTGKRGRRIAFHCHLRELPPHGPVRDPLPTHSRAPDLRRCAPSSGMTTIQRAEAGVWPSLPTARRTPADIAFRRRPPRRPWSFWVIMVRTMCSASTSKAASESDTLAAAFRLRFM